MIGRQFSRIQFKIWNRNFAHSSHDASAPATGFEGIVRKYLPGNHHVVMGILGFYVSSYFILSAVFGKKKNGALIAIATDAGDGHSIPPIDSPAFDQWISTPGNVEKCFADLK